MDKRRILSALAILLTMSMVKSVYACQPYFFTPYVFQLNDGKHVFAMVPGSQQERADREGKRENETEADRYPRAGLYSRGDSKHPVWLWDGPIIEYDNLKKSISSDGRVLFFVNDMVSEKSVFLSVYHDGVKIREYGMKPFIDRAEQLVSFPCESGHRWAKNWHFGASNDRLTVESFADRVVEIEAETGSIISSVPIIKKDLKGRLEIRNGRQLSVSKIGICEQPEPAGKRLTPQMENLMYIFQPVVGAFIRDEDGLTDVPAFTISEVQETSAGDGFTLQNRTLTTIRLDHVRRIEFAPMEDSTDVISSIELIDESSLQWQIGSGAWKICAREADGE